MDLFEEENPIYTEETLAGWIMSRVDEWKEAYQSNYQQKHDEYYRIWRGIWREEDKTRVSERSKLISPATQQAVESSVAEVEEATFGRGRFFEIEDDIADQQKGDVELVKNQLHEDFKKRKVRKAISEALLNAAVFGTGIAEIVLSEVKESVPATQPILNGALNAVGTLTQKRTVVDLRPILPQNFFIDPAAVSIETALGAGIDEYVPTHSIQLLQEQGTYRKVSLGTSDMEFNLEPDKTEPVSQATKTRKTTYYGLVPRKLLEAANSEPGDEVVPLSGETDESYYVEAIVILANGGDILKAEENPYMMGDRSLIAFQWDIVPGKFWGRGVCEKGYNSQKALDAELRARQDALALAVHPVIGIDSTRIPRGMSTDVRPGKTLLTIGRPSEVVEPFKIGGVDQITFAQAEALQKMLQMATGAIDSTGLPGTINGESTAAGISMSLGAVIKRHKRTLINFQEAFIIPFVEKAAWRYMQFDPERYPAADYKFIATSSLGIIAREYEVTQLVQLLQTMSPESPLYPSLITSIIDNMSLANREQLKETLQKASQPTPEQQQQAQEAHAAEMRIKSAQAAALEGSAAEAGSRADKYRMETELLPQELEIKKVSAVSKNVQSGDGDDREFEKRIRITDALLKEREVAIKERQQLQSEKEAERESNMLAMIKGRQ